MSRELPTISKILKQHGYSVTKVRGLVFNALANCEPLSMGELQHKLATHMNRTSVYRTLDLFEKTGIVKRLQIGWKHKFELSDIFLDHHHHATCMRCGSVYKFELDRAIEKRLGDISRSMDFRITEHSLELRGICASCKPQ